MFGSAAFFVTILAMTYVQATNVQQCLRNDGRLPISTEVVGCSSVPCQLPQLQDAVLNIQFQAPHDIGSMRTLATAYIQLGPITLPVPYDLEEKAVTCNYLVDANCPLTAGQIVQYTLRMYIEPYFPVGEEPIVEFRVVDQNNYPIFCIRVPLVIVAPVSKSALPQA